MSFSAQNNFALYFIVVKQFSSQSFCVNAFHFVNWSIAVTKRLNNGRRRCCLFRKIWNRFYHFVLNSYSIFIEMGKNQHFSSQRMYQSRKCNRTVGVLLMLFLFPFTVFPFMDSSVQYQSDQFQPANRPFLIELIFRKIIKLF